MLRVHRHYPTVAGGGSSTANNVAATTTSLSGPNSVAIDSSGNLYISDSFHNLVRKVNASTGVITTVAGGGTSPGTDGFEDGGAATSAALSNPTGIAVDFSANIYIADTNDGLVRFVNSSTGVITAVAGNGIQGSSGNGGTATEAELVAPTAVRLDAAGNIYIVDFSANLVRFVSAQTSTMYTIAGDGTAAYTGDGGLAVSASLSSPSDIALDPSGNLYIADYGNNVIRKLTFCSAYDLFPIHQRASR